MTSIFLTKRAQENKRYRAWLLDVNLSLIMNTGLSLDQYLFRATSTWRWFRERVQPKDAAWKISQAQP